MKKLSVILGTLFLLSFSTLQFSEKNLIGSWKIVKVKNSIGSEIDSTAFIDETFTYKVDYSVIHFNPHHPIEPNQLGMWEIKGDTLFQFNTNEKKMPFKILTLNKKELIVQQEMEDVVTTIFYEKINTTDHN